MMSSAEELFLTLVVTAFTSFGIFIAVLSWLDGKYDKRVGAASKEAARDAAHAAELSRA